MSPLTTWRELHTDVAGAHSKAAAAYEAVGDNLMHGGKRSDALYDLTDALATARDNLERLSRLLEDSDEPEKPTRPLQAVLADILALGFRYSLSPNDVSTYLGAVGAANAASQWHTTRLDEEGDVVAAAEAELTRIRELYAGVVALVEMLGYRPERPTEADIEAFIQSRTHERPTEADIEAFIQSRTHERPTEADIEVFLAAIGAGPEEAENATHIIAGVGFITIIDSLVGRFVYGYREEDDQPHKVVEHSNGAIVGVPYEFPTEDEARAAVAEMNAGKWLEPLFPAEGLAREDVRRESQASEEATS